MADIPLDAIALRDCRTSARVQAQIVDLTRDLAQVYIDARWWANLGIGYRRRDTAEDHHWLWYKKVGSFRTDHFVRSVAVQTLDKEIQGAMIYHLNGNSLLEPGEGAVFVNYLAAAPRNRDQLLNHPGRTNNSGWVGPRYRGVGGGLLTLATLHSYERGFRGRVNLQSLPGSEGFYRRQNFLWTGTEVDGMLVYELSSDQALSDLRSWGFL
jgi:hypothetical protein